MFLVRYFVRDQLVVPSSMSTGVIDVSDPLPPRYVGTMNAAEKPIKGALRGR